jgi:molecular chaperone GrpE (heat shock protein)
MKSSKNKKNCPGCSDNCHLDNSSEKINAGEDKSLQEELLEMKDLLMRTQANFENYRKQSERRILEFQKFASKNLLIQLFPIVDHLELALKNTENKGDFIDGVKLIFSQLKTVFDDNNVTTIDSLGKTFDPNLHEALMKVPSSEDENTIIEVFQEGYLIDNAVIRHAKVKVSAGNKEKE